MAAKFGNKCKKACLGGGRDDDCGDDDYGGRNNCRGGGNGVGDCDGGPINNNQSAQQGVEVETQ